MDTKFVYVAVLAIAIGGLMWQLAGFADLFAAESPGEGLDSPANASQQADDSVIDDNFSGNAQPSSGDLVGLIVSGITNIFKMAMMVVFLPGELAELGLPDWAAQPVGTLATILISVGLVQFASGRVFR